MFLFYFFAKSWNFCDINRRSTRPDNFVTGVKTFPYVRVARRVLQSVVLYLHAASYNLLVTSPLAYSVYEQRGNFVTTHCVC